MERYEQFLAQHPRIALGAALSGGTFTVVGLAGVPSDLENWSAAFQAIGSNLGRWLLVIAGLAAIATVALSRFRSPNRLPETTPREPPMRPGDLARRHTSQGAPSSPVPGRVYGGAAVGTVVRQRAEQEKERAVYEAAEGEIALALEEAVELKRLLFDEGPWITPTGTELEEGVPDWREKTTQFIGSVLGSGHRAAFRTVNTGSDATDRLESEAEFLGDLAQKLSPDSIRVSEEEFLSARETRRENKAAKFFDYDHFRAPGAPPKAQREQAPELSFGQVYVPRSPQRRAFNENPEPHDFVTGRVLRVPVINAPGKDTAKSVQALLTFRPDDQTGWMSPRDPALAEWDVEPVATAIDIPGNGQPQLFDVAFVLDAERVCVHQWTHHSREAALQGYGIAGKGIIKVEVRCAGQDGEAPSPLVDTLHIEALEGSLCAQWESEGLGTRKNCVPWKEPPMMGPPPGT